MSTYHAFFIIKLVKINHIFSLHLIHLSTFYYEKNIYPLSSQSDAIYKSKIIFKVLSFDIAFIFCYNNI